MSLIISLLILAIVIPALALLGHLYVAYALAPKRAKESILNALIEDQEFRTELIKSLLNALFQPITDKDVTVIPIDSIIARAKIQFGEWIKNELPKDIPQNSLVPVQSYDDQGNPQYDPVQALIMANLPKKLHKYLPLLQAFLNR